jgi:hypothetical protein
MTITTKFNIGDKAWILLGKDHYAKPTEVEIEAIRLFISKEYQNLYISYTIFNPNSKEKEEFNESVVFATKEELIKSLA